MKSELYRAIEGDDTDSALALIAAGADLNVGFVMANGTIYPNLYAAIQKGNTGVALALIEKGANLDNGWVLDNGSTKSNLSVAIQKGNTEVALALIAKGAQLSASIYNEGIKNPEIAKALIRRLYRGECFPSLSALTMFSLSGVPNQETVPLKVLEQYSSYTKDIAFLKEHGDKLTPLSEKVAKECGVPQKALSMLVRCAAREGAESRQHRAPGR